MHKLPIYIVVAQFNLSDPTEVRPSCNILAYACSLHSDAHLHINIWKAKRDNRRSCHVFHYNQLQTILFNDLKIHVKGRWENLHNLQCFGLCEFLFSTEPVWIYGPSLSIWRYTYKLERWDVDDDIFTIYWYEYTVKIRTYLPNYSQIIKLSLTAFRICRLHFCITLSILHECNYYDYFLLN